MLADPPVVRGLIVRSWGRDHAFSGSDVERLSHSGAVLRRGAVESDAGDRDPQELLVRRDLLDIEVVDRQGPGVVRVNDVAIGLADGGPRIVGVDISALGLLRRLAPRGLTAGLKSEITEWSRIELMTAQIADVAFRLPHDRIERLHPSDIGRIIDHLPYRLGAELLASIDQSVAADALEEVEKHRQPEILDYIPPDRAVAILDSMAPDAAADLLEDLPRDKTDRLLAGMAPACSADVRMLLSYPSDTAGGLMTTDLVIAPQGETAREAIQYIRAQLRKPDLVYYVYIVDDPDNRRLRGVISLRDLLLAEPSQPLGEYMKGPVRTIGPETGRKEVARVMGEYNLLALPVVDEHGRLLGLVTVDDILDCMLPRSMRQHLPRLFS